MSEKTYEEMSDAMIMGRAFAILEMLQAKHRYKGESLLTVRYVGQYDVHHKHILMPEFAKLSKLSFDFNDEDKNLFEELIEYVGIYDKRNLSNKIIGASESSDFYLQYYKKQSELKKATYWISKSLFRIKDLATFIISHFT